MDITRPARRLMDVPRQGVRTALEAPRQVSDAWSEGFELVRRAGRLLDRVEAVVGRVEVELSEVELITDSARGLVRRIDEVAEHAAIVSEEARLTRLQAEEQVLRVRHLLDAYQPILESLAPLGREAASLMQVAHVRGLVTLLDELPHLVDKLQPALEGMGQLVPHLEGVTDRMDNVAQVVEGLPGAKTLRRRGQAREESTD